MGCRYFILIDEMVVESVEGEEAAREKAKEVQENIRRYIQDEFGGAFAMVGFAPADRPKEISYLKPRDGVPDALVPNVFRQLRDEVRDTGPESDEKDGNGSDKPGDK